MLEWLIDLVMGNNYIAAASIFIAFYALSETAVLLFEKVFLKFARKTKTDLDDRIVSRTNRPVSLLLLGVGAKLSLIHLELGGRAEFITSKLISSFITAVILYLVIAVIGTLANHWGERFAKRTKSTVDDHLLSLLNKSLKVVFFVAVILFVLKIWGIEIGPMLAGLGIGGVAVAFALQNTLGNIFGGISLILDKNIKVGEMIKLSDGTMGTVMDIGLRSTKIRTFDNEIVVVPNGDISSKKLQNMTQPSPSGRVVVPFGVAYGSDIEKVKKIVLKEINKIGGVSKEKDKQPWVWFTEMADSALLFNAYFWMKDYNDRWRAKDEANTLIYNALNKNKITIPFPQMDVHLKRS